jgi:hypothetical protein
MALCSCRVTISDMNGVIHSAGVTASTLYEAVALALAAMRANEWVGEIAEGLNTAKVCVTTVPVEHSVRMQDFKNWVNRTGGSPREVADRSRIRSILGVQDSQKL